MVENILSVRRNFRRRAFLVWAGLFLFIIYLALIGIGYLVFHARFFKVHSFEFSGFKKTDSLAVKHFLILKKIENSRLAWLLTPANFLFWADNAIVNTELLSEIASLKIFADFSKRKVLIKVSERQPFGIWCHNKQMENGKWKIDIDNCFWFDKLGILFNSAPFAEGVLIPLIFDENSRPEKLNEEIFSLFQRLYDLEKIKIAKVLIKDENLKELEAEIINGPKIYLSLKEKNEDLEAILNKLSGQSEFKNWQYIDLRVPGRIYYK